MAGDLADVIRGDTVIVSGDGLATAKAKVTAAGVKWLTVNGQRYGRETGRHVSGQGHWRIETVAGHAERIERDEIEERLRRWGWHVAQSKVSLTMDQLYRARDLIDAFEAAQAADLPDALRGYSFQRAGCRLVRGESLLAARARGNAAEEAMDAVKALREGDLGEAKHLLVTAKYDLDTCLRRRSDPS